MPSTLVETILTPEDRRYRCCLGGGCCHVRTCVFVIGILELLALATAVVTLFVLYELTAESFMDRNLNKPGHQLQKSTWNKIDISGQRSSRITAGQSFGEAKNTANTSKITRIHHHPLDSSESSSEEEADSKAANGWEKGGKASESSSEEEIEKKKDLIYLRAKHRYYVRSMVGAAFAFVVGVFVVALMFTGLMRGRPRWLLPHLAVQVLAIIGLAIVIALYSFWCATVDEGDESKRHLYPINQSISCWLIIGSCTIALILELISFWCVLLCYRYLTNLTQIEYNCSDTNRFLVLDQEKQVGGMKWAHRSSTAPGVLVPGYRV